MPQLNLEQIGHLAGVSRSTVSRVVNGEANVSERARRKVLAVIEETGYRPHAAAKSLASRRTNIVGLIIPSAVASLFDDPYFGRLILGVTRGVNDLGMTLAMLLAEPGAAEQGVIPRVVNPGLVDGVIVTASRMDEPIFGHLEAAGMPYVVVGRAEAAGTLGSVDADNRGGAKLAVKHLLALGKGRLALIAPPQVSGAGVDRRGGFLEAVAEAGLSVDGREREGDWSQDSGELAMRELLESRPDGVFVGSDRMAVGALRAIAEAGLRCPEDVAVVSFDGVIPANQTTPQLTTVAQPVGDIGERAARLLRSVIDGDVTTPERVVFSTELIVRESCGAGAQRVVAESALSA